LFFQRTHDPLFRAVQLSVATNDIEPGVALAKDHDKRNRQSPRLHACGEIVEGGDESDDAGVNRQEEGVRQPPPRTDPICHLDVQLVLLEEGGVV
jgi:hypothetical protein